MPTTNTPGGTIDNLGAVQPDNLTLSGIPFASGSAQTFAPLIIHPIFASDITNRVSSAADPTTTMEFENAVTAAINYIETEFASSAPAIFNNGTITNGVTINIAFDYGTLNGVALAAGTDASRSQSNAYLFTWPQIKSLIPNAPTTDPTKGDEFYLPFSEMKALGFVGNTTITATSPEVDGYVALNTAANGVSLDYNLNDLTIPGEVNAVGAIEHEITEVFGRISILGSQSAGNIPIYTLLDMFRYTAPGVPTLNAGPADYFSVNGGTTDLGFYDNATNGGDAGDWAASVTNDSFDAFLIPGSADTISAVDSAELNVPGFTPLIAPIAIRGTAAKQPTTDTATVHPFSAAVVNDPNPGQTDTVTVTLSTTANGTITNPGGGQYNAATGVYTDTGSSGAIAQALSGLVFTPNAHQVAPGQTVTTTFTITDTDTAGVNATDGTTSVVTTVLGVSPVITGTTAGQTTTDQIPITVFPAVAVTDINMGQTETVTVTLAAPSNGSITNLGGGTWNAATGVWSDTGPGATISAALDGLVFTPTAKQVASGQTVTTGFAITVTDTAGLTATDGTTRLVTQATTASVSGLLGGLTISQQLELIYIAYFNRAADGDGFAFWGGQSAQAENAGQSAATALTNVANAFTPQPETIALYPFLSAPSVNLNAQTTQAGLGAFINSIYGNLFGHPPDTAGETYWVGQITSGAVSPGAAALAIANGATGSDAVEVLNKVSVAFDFTTRTTTAGLGRTSPLPGGFITAARSGLSGIDGASLNDASVTSGMAATSTYLTGATTGLIAGPGVPAGSGDGNIIIVSGQNQLIDPGAGDHTIRFLPGASGDTLAPRADGVDQVSGFDPGTDFLDLAGLLVAAKITPDVATLANYLSITEQGADAVVQFDPTGQGNGATVAVLWSLGDVAAGMNALLANGVR